MNTANMNTTTYPPDNTQQNLLVVDNSRQIMSRRVSQLYGTTLIRALAHTVRLQDVYHTGLMFFEPWTLQNIKEDAQAINPDHNIMFVDDKRRILSCHIDPDHGKALLEGLPQDPTEVADDAQAALSHNTNIQSSEASSSKQGTGAKSSHRPSTQSKALNTNPSSPLFNTSATPTANAGILSDQILSTLNRQPYDRYWMRKNDIDESCLNGPSSKLTLDVLLKNGAIKAGDLLCVKYKLDDGNLKYEVGQVSRCCFPASPIRSKGNAYTDFSTLLFLGLRSSRPSSRSTRLPRPNPPNRHGRHLTRP